MIHGNTRITLRNPISGNIIKDVESENTFQGEVLAKQLNRYGEFACPSSWGFADLVGGIFLFNDTIQVGNRFMPAGVEMIGHGYRECVTSGIYPYLGTFNSAESGYGEDTSNHKWWIKQVYDYATNQANGTIKSVCLTSKKGGQIGYGVSSNYTRLEFEDIAGTDIGMNGAQGCYYNNYRYRVSDCADNKISIEKMPVDITGGNIFRGMTKTLQFNISGQEAVSAYWTIMGDAGNGKFRFACPQVGSSGKSVAANAAINYYEFDASNDSLTYKNFTNKSGVTLHLANMGVQFRGKYALINDFDTYDVYIFNVDDNEFVRKLESCRDFSIYNGDTATYWQPAEISDGLILYQAKVNYDSVTKMYDAVADKIFETNLQINNYSSHELGAPTRMASCDDIMKFYIRGDNRVCKNPLYLATINNLATPVIKNAALAMKVEYTLTEA